MSGLSIDAVRRNVYETMVGDFQKQKYHWCLVPLSVHFRSNLFSKAVQTQFLSIQGQYSCYGTIDPELIKDLLTLVHREVTPIASSDAAAPEMVKKGIFSKALHIYNQGRYTSCLIFLFDKIEFFSPAIQKNFKSFWRDQEKFLDGLAVHWEQPKGLVREEDIVVPLPVLNRKEQDPRKIAGLLNQMEKELYPPNNSNHSQGGSAGIASAAHKAGDVALSSLQLGKKEATPFQLYEDKLAEIKKSVASAETFLDGFTAFHTLQQEFCNQIKKTPITSEIRKLITQFGVIVNSISQGPYKGLVADSDLFRAVQAADHTLKTLERLSGKPHQNQESGQSTELGFSNMQDFQSTLAMFQSAQSSRVAIYQLWNTVEFLHNRPAQLDDLIMRKLPDIFDALNQLKLPNDKDVLEKIGQIIAVVKKRAEANTHISNDGVDNLVKKYKSVITQEEIKWACEMIEGASPFFTTSFAHHDKSVLEEKVRLVWNSILYFSGLVATLKSGIEMDPRLKQKFIENMKNLLPVFREKGLLPEDQLTGLETKYGLLLSKIK